MEADNTGWRAILGGHEPSAMDARDCELLRRPQRGRATINLVLTTIKKSPATTKTYHPSADLRAGYGTETRRKTGESQLHRGDAEKNRFKTGCLRR